MIASSAPPSPGAWRIVRPTGPVSESSRASSWMPSPSTAPPPRPRAASPSPSCWECRPQPRGRSLLQRPRDPLRLRRLPRLLSLPGLVGAAVVDSVVNEVAEQAAVVVAALGVAMMDEAVGEVVGGAGRLGPVDPGVVGEVEAAIEAAGEVIEAEGVVTTEVADVVVGEARVAR